MEGRIVRRSDIMILLLCKEFLIEKILIDFLLQEGVDGGEDSQEEQRPPDITPI